MIVSGPRKVNLPDGFLGGIRDAAAQPVRCGLLVVERIGAEPPRGTLDDSEAVPTTGGR